MFTPYDMQLELNISGSQFPHYYSNEFAATNLLDTVLLQIFQFLRLTKMISCQMMCKEPSITDVSTCCDFKISKHVQPIILNEHELTATETNLLLLKYVGMHIVRLSAWYSDFEPTDAVAISRSVRKNCLNLQYFSIEGSAEQHEDGYILAPPHMSTVKSFVFDFGERSKDSIISYLNECNPSVLSSVLLIETDFYRYNENVTRNLSKEQIARVNWFAKCTALREFRYISNYDISNDLRPILLAIPKLTHFNLMVLNEGDPLQSRFAEEFNRLQTELIQQNHLVYMRLYLRYGSYLPETLAIMPAFTSLRRLRVTGSVVGIGFLNSIMELPNLRQFFLANSPPHHEGLNFKEVMDFVRGCRSLRKFTILYSPWFDDELHLSMLRRLRRDVEINMERDIMQVLDEADRFITD